MKRKITKKTSNDSLVPNDIVIQNVKFNDKQKSFINLCNQKDFKLFFVDGPAGTSKTYISVYCALRLLELKQVSKLIYIRSAVESAAQKLGSLPGEIDEKFKPWVIPLIDKLQELSRPDVVEYLIKNNIIEAHPNNYLRGMSFVDRVIVVDESQNMTVSELITILTRIGENCKVFVIGDSMQSDINKSGFKTIFNLFETAQSVEHGIYTFRFDEEDIVRSELLKFIVNQLKKLNV